MYFKAVIEEVMGGYEYSHNYLIKADSFENAVAIADYTAENWCGKTERKEGEWYIHCNGKIEARVRGVVPVFESCLREGSK